MALEKAFLVKESKQEERIPFLFNPEQFTVEKSNHFAEIDIPGLGSPLLQFVRGNSKTFKMDLFFDTCEERKVGGATYSAGTDVRELTNKVTDLMEIDSDTHAPPICLFSWGKSGEKGQAFRCILESISKRFTYFWANGNPVRATLSVTLKEYTSVEIELRERKRHSADHTKRRVVKQGDTLSGIAAKEYGDPAEWRRIAIENNIDNPRKLPPGERLTIPPMH